MPGLSRCLVGGSFLGCQQNTKLIHNTWHRDALRSQPTKRALSLLDISHASKTALFSSSKSDSAFHPSHQSLGQIGSAPMLETESSTSKHTSEAQDIQRHDVPTDQRSSLRKARKKVSMLRDRLYRQRLALGEKRNELRQERADLAAIDTKFMNTIRQSWDNGVTPDTAQVESIFAELESKRDELGTIQYDYDTAEADHDVAEARFEDEEQKLEKLIFRLLNLQADSEIQSSETSSETYSAPSEVFSVDRTEQPHRDYIDQTSPTDAINDSLRLEKELIPSSLQKSKSLDHLHIELWVQDAMNNNISDTDGQQRRSAPSKREKSKLKQLPQTGYHRMPEISSETDIQATQLFEIKLETRSESALVPLQHRFDESRPRISWWILHTFGSSPEDYFRRGQAQSLFAEIQDRTISDEQWARLVFDYWKRDQVENQFPEDVSEASWEEIVSQEIPEANHPRRLTFGGSYLLLSSELAKAKYSLENYDRLFPSGEAPHSSPPTSKKGSTSPDVDKSLNYRRRSA